MVSSDIVIAVSVAICLTALLVALMFAVLWVKVGKKQGRHNLLTPSEIEEFRKGSMTNENKPIAIKTVDSFDNVNGVIGKYDPIHEIKRDQLLLGK